MHTADRVIGAEGTLLKERALVREGQLLLKEIKVTLLLESVVKAQILVNTSQYS